MKQIRLPNYFFTDLKNNLKNYNYINFDIDSVNELSDILKTKNLRGLNITIPYKEKVLKFIDRIDEDAKFIGAINTIKVSYDNTLVGYNTDYIGFIKSIKPHIKSNHKKALILGTGGASKAIAFVLKNIGIDVLYVSRNPRDESKHFSYEEVNDNMIHACKLIINCTPVGSYPNTDEILPIPFSAIGADHLVIDLIYNPEKTKFLQEAERQGATIMNGKSMLQEQALKSWEYWNQ